MINLELHRMDMRFSQEVEYFSENIQPTFNSYLVESQRVNRNFW